MFHKKIHTMAALALSLVLLTPAKANAADYQLSRIDTKMTCTDLKTGETVKSQFVKIKKKTYYFDAHGYAHTGWLKKGRDYYFFNADGSMLKNAWMNQYYFLKSGKMAKNRWVGKKKNRVYVGADGRVIPGYQKNAKAKFVNTPEGKKYRNYDGTYSEKTWQCIKGKWYYFYSTGILATKRQIGDFYVDSQGRMVHKKWVRIGNMKYYYGADGRLKRSLCIKPSKKKTNTP